MPTLALRFPLVEVSHTSRPAGTYTLQQAAERAKALLLDPQAAGKTRDGATLAEYIHDHYSEHALARLKTGAQAVKRIKVTWKPLLAKRIADITAATSIACARSD